MKNVIVGISTMAISFLFTFFYRWAFLKLFSVDYLGISGLFSSIISILSLTELGFNGAVMFSLYKPAAQNDETKISAILKYYRNIYYAVAGIVLVIGLCFLPFLNNFIRDVPNVSPNIYIMYLFTLAGSVLSYFNSYKFTMLIVDQKEYITKIVFFVCKLCIQGLQLLFLFITHDYYSVLILDVVLVMVQNLILTIIVNKKYPYLRKKKEKLSRAEKVAINKYSASMMLHKVSSIVLSSTDNIIITSFLGVIVLGYCTNYILLTSALSSVINAVFSGMMASLGNYIFSKKKNEQYDLYLTTALLGTWFAMFVSVGFFFVSQDFISVWLGSQFRIDNLTVLMLALSLFVENYARSIGSFCTTMGLFKKTAPFSLLFAFLNLGISILLVMYMGLAGVFLGTVISRVVSLPLEIYIVNKHGFQIKLRDFYKKIAVQIFVVILAVAATYAACLVPISNLWASFFYKIAVVCIVPNVIYALLLCKTKEFQYLRSLFKGKLIGLINKIRASNNKV